MPYLSEEITTPELRIALAYTPEPLRLKLATVLALDERLGKIVAATTEPMLGQVRLAWWRENLTKPTAERPRGDAVLDAVATHWEGQEERLAKLVDGWEHLIGEGLLPLDDARAFASGRQLALVSVFEGQPEAQSAQSALSAAAWHWALADLAANVSDEAERTALIELGLEVRRTKTGLPKWARGLAVLGALGLRSLKNDGRPLMEGRGASLIAMKTAILGR